MKKVWNNRATPKLQASESLDWWQLPWSEYDHWLKRNGYTGLAAARKDSQRREKRKEAGLEN